MWTFLSNMRHILEQLYHNNTCFWFHSLTSSIRYSLTCFCFHSLISSIRYSLTCFCFHSLISSIRYSLTYSTSLYTYLNFISVASCICNVDHIGLMYVAVVDAIFYHGNPSRFIALNSAHHAVFRQSLHTSEV